MPGDNSEEPKAQKGRNGRPKSEAEEKHGQEGKGEV